MSETTESVERETATEKARLQSYFPEEDMKWFIKWPDVLRPGIVTFDIVSGDAETSTGVTIATVTIPAPLNGEDGGRIANLLVNAPRLWKSLQDTWSVFPEFWTDGERFVESFHVLYDASSDRMPFAVTIDEEERDRLLGYNAEFLGASGPTVKAD